MCGPSRHAERVLSGKPFACLTVVPDVHGKHVGIEAHVNATLASPLTAADRCDRCGAKAYIRARLHAGGELLFCAHHGREHIPALKDLAEIEDETARLDESTPASAPVEER